ncbi:MULTISPECIES: ankyrin repeat domain-containing protein [unclassified Wolbachia]|uniref:ankyrin repeat domain-containing protein n=1 Tax=unclassified Wolbachia TaxID=2640676 RepID=UPI0021F917C6|nr:MULTISPECIES: ankyrin repeat domain-containing protein [unclassified Wolbachia]
MFGINGILDAMDDVRTSVSISHTSKVGKLISKVPQPVRQTFVKIISNPVVQSITFVTIAYQFGYSVNEIAQGNHHPLNYYWTTSSGVKLASMGIRPISAGVSFTVKSVSTTTKILRGLSAASKVLGRAAVVTMVADVLITIGVEIHERMEYTKAIAEQVPLLPGGEQAEVFFAKVIKFFTGRDIEKEYEDIIRVKGYLNHVKEVAIRLLDDNYNVAAVVQYVFGIKEEYNKLISGYSQNMPASMNDQSSYICQFKNNYTSLSFENQHNEASNLSSLDLFNTLSLTLHTLVMSKGWEEFKCAFTRNLQCRQTVRDKEVYVIDRGKKYLPDITKYEYEDVGLRVVDVPLGTLSERNLKCSSIINVRECSDGIVIGDEVRHIQSKDIGKAHKSCTHELVIHSNNIKPFVFTSPTRKDPYHIRKETFPRDSVLYISLPRIFTAIANYPAVMHVPEGSSIRCTGSKNNETIFIINDRTSGTLEGGTGKENTLIMNVKASNIVADLYSGTIHYSNNDNIRLVNTYNYVSNSDSKQSITTHCKTRLINAKNAEVWQNSFNCADKDYEVRVVNKEDIHHRGLKQTIFIVNKDSNNSRIVSDFNYTEKIKKNIDVIDVQVADITRLSVNESIERGSYSLDFLADSTQNIVSSIKIDSFKNLVIQAKRLGVIESVVIQDKSLSNIIEDMRYQKLSDLGKDIDREIIQNSEKKLKAVIKASILDLEWPNTYQAAKNIADNNNLGIPISEVEVIKNYVGVPTEKVIIAGTYSDRIIVDFSYSDSNSTHSHLRHRANGGNYDYDQYMIVCNYYQDIIIEGKEEQDRYVVKIPEYGQMLQHNILGSPIKLDLNLKVKNKATLYQNVPDDIIDLTALNVVDVDSISIKKGKRTYFNKCNSREVSDLTDNSLEIKNVTVSDGKGIKWSLSIGLVDYFRGQEYQNIVLQMNNKFYKINNANLELEYVEVNTKPFRYYQPDKQGLQIYHNQPINENDIGLVDLKEKSIFDFDMEVVDDSLLLLHKNNTIAKVENWNVYQPARKMVFAFNDTMVSNLDCTASTCNSGNVIYSFNKAKETLLKEQLFNAIRQDNTNEVKNLIRRITGSTDAEDKHELTSLYIAIQEGRSDVVKFLFDRKSVNVKDEDIHGNSPLHWAALEGELSITQFLVNEGANIEDKNKGNQTPEDLANQEGYAYIAGFLRQIQLNRELLTAAEGGNLNKVKDLSEKGANLETKNNSGWTPLHYASLYNHFEVVEYLVGRIANLEAKDNNGWTPLHYVSLKDYQLKIMDYLTKSGANLEAKDDSGRTPLHCASLNGSLKLVKYLIKAKASLEVRDNSDRTPLHNACLSKNLKVVEYLINNGADLEAKDSNSRTPLHCVSLDGYPEVVEYLIKRGANLEVKDKDGKTPLELAIQGNYTNVVKILKQAQLDKKLFTAVESGDLNEVTNLITQGDYINATDKSAKTSLRYSAYEGANIGAKDLYGWTPLHYAIYRNDLDILKFLLGKGANIEAKDINDETPLHIAAKDNNKSKVVRLLLDNGARTEAKNKVGWTPLHYAAYKDNLDVCKLLLERNADVEAKNTYDETPLHVAAENSNKSKVTAEFLLDKGANINAKNKDGWTPLHYAAYKDNLDVCKLLVKRGTSIEARDNGDRTPLDVAGDEGHNNIVEYLEGKLKKEREKPAQRKRRHHHGDHDRHRSHLSRNLLAIDSSGQLEMAASSGTRTSSWINGLFGWVKSSVGGLLNPKPEKISSTKDSISQIDAPMDVNGTIMLLDVLVRKVTGQKYISTVDQPISSLKAQGYALNITKGFEKVVEQAGLKSGVLMHRLNIDFVEIQKEVTGKIMSGKFNEISRILKLYIKKACLGEEAGKLSPKKFDKFMVQFNSRLNVVLNQPIQQMLHNENGTLEVDGAKQMSLESQSYLSNASVHSHSGVSTCLSEIGVTKLVNNLSR